jgi:4-amino-4-deoxy-L-arabinose transferase-like glycosyltransferase
VLLQLAERRTWNPLRHEQDAFQLLIATIGYFAAIAVASALGGVWAGLAVFAVLTIASVAWLVYRNRRVEPPGS